MINTIISIGAFVIGVIVIYYVAMIALGLIIIFWRYIAGFLVIAAVAIFAITATQARADSIDVTYFTYLSTPAIEADKSNMAIGYTLDMTDSTSIKAGVMDNKSSSLYVMFKARKKYKYISYGISAGFMPNIKTEVVNYLSPKYDGKHISFERKSYVSTEVNEMALTVMPSVSFYYEKHAIELGYSPKLNDYEESRYMAQYQYSF